MPVFFAQYPRVLEDFGNFFVVVIVECISPFVVYSVICHGCVGWMKQLLLVQVDWKEPQTVSGKNLIGLESPAVVPLGLGAWILSFGYFPQFGRLGKEEAGEKQCLNNW